MSFTEHCNLCDNVRMSLKDGMVCGLSNQKPVFEERCPKIQLNEKFEKKIGLIHIEIESLNKNKNSIYFYSILFIVIGLLLLFSQRNFLSGFDLTYEKYLKSVRSLLVIFIGLTLLRTGYNKLTKHRKRINFVKKEKEKIENVLNKYQINYNCSVNFIDKYFGNKKVVVELKSDSKLLKDSKITYQI